VSETRELGDKLGVLREQASHLILRRHLEVAEFEARRHGTAAERVPITIRQGGLPSARGDDVLRTLAPTEIVTEEGDRMRTPIVELVQDERIAPIVVPDLVARDAVERAERPGRQEKIDRRARRARRRMGQPMKRERRTPGLSIEAPFRMGRELEESDDAFGLGM
jgi:hypothetical protein